MTFELIGVINGFDKGDSVSDKQWKLQMKQKEFSKKLDEKSGSGIKKKYDYKVSFDEAFS